MAGNDNGQTSVSLWTDANDAIANYLPANFVALDIEVLGDDPIRTAYTVGSKEIQSVVFGSDQYGWTFEGYVKPRLASGLYFPAFVVPSDQADGMLEIILSAIFGNGFGDDECSDVDNLVGWVGRFDRWILRQDSLGFKSVETWFRTYDAMLAFNRYEQEDSEPNEDEVSA